MKKITILLISFLTILLLAACTEESSNEAENKENNEEGKNTEQTEERPNELHIATNSVPPTLDAHFSDTAVTLEVASHIYETLFTYNENFIPTPHLAKDYEQSEDLKELTIYLREGVPFHNGKEMKAEDVVASLTRWAEIAPQGRTAFASLEEMVEVDEYTVKFTFSEPAGHVLDALANYVQFSAIMPKEVIEGATETGVEEYIGTGVYKFVEWIPDQYVHLTKFDDYASLETEPSGKNGKRVAYINDLYFKPATDGAAKLMGLQSGEYDFANGVETENYQQVLNDENLEPFIRERALYGTFVLNHHGKLGDLKLRQALLAALDMEEINAVASGSEEFYALDGGIVNPNNALYTDAGTELYNQNDPEKAKKLLEESGWDGSPIRFITTRDYEYMYRSVTVMAQQLEEVGIPSEVEVFDWATLSSFRIDEGNKDKWDIYMTRFALYPDPLSTQYLSPTFEAGYESPEMTAAYNAMKQSRNVEEKKEHFEKVQQLIYEDVVAIPVGHLNQLNGKHKDLEMGVNFLNVNFFNAKWK